jgi:hypothetical protein
MAHEWSAVKNGIITMAFDNDVVATTMRRQQGGVDLGSV